MSIVIQFILCGVISFIVNVGLCLKIIDIAAKNPGGPTDRLWQTGYVGYVTWTIIFLACLAGNIYLF